MNVIFLPRNPIQILSDMQYRNVFSCCIYQHVALKGLIVYVFIFKNTSFQKKKKRKKKKKKKKLNLGFLSAGHPTFFCKNITYYFFPKKCLSITLK